MSDERTKYSDALKQKVARAHVDEGRPVAELSEEFKIAHSMIYLWCKRYRETGGVAVVNDKRGGKRKKKQTAREQAAPDTRAESAPIARDKSADLRAQLAQRDQRIAYLERSVVALRAAMEALLAPPESD